MKTPSTTLTRCLVLGTTGALMAGLVSASPASADNVDVAPTKTVSGQMSGPVGIDSDGNGNIYVASQLNNSVVVHARDSSGASSPLRRIQGAATGLNSPFDVALDSNGFAYVTNLDGVVRVFGPGADGNVAPAKSFGTGAGPSWGIDIEGGDIYVRKDTAYHVYAPSAAGFPAATQRAVTGLGLGYAVTVDGSKVWTTVGTQLRSYAATSDGAAGPSQSVLNASNGAQTYGLDTDSAGRVHVTSFTGTMRVYAPDADGATAPLKLLGGPASDLAATTGVTVLSGGSLAIARYNAATYSVYATLFTAPKPVAKKPGKVRALKVGGAARAKNRRVRWVAPKSNGGAAITSYRIVVRKGNRTLVVKNVGSGRRSLVLKRSTLRNGVNTVRVQAKNSKGFGPVAKKNFRVRK